MLRHYHQSSFSRIHPLIIFLIGLIVGITFSSLFCIVISISIALLSAVALLTKKIQTFSFAKIICISLGILIGNARYNAQISDHTIVSSSCIKGPCTIIATVTALQSVEHTFAKYCMRVQVTKIVQPTVEKIFSYPVTYIAYYSQPYTIEIGDTISINNVQIKPPKNNDFKNYLIKENIHGTLFLSAAPTVLYRPTYSLQRWIHTQKMSLLQRLESKLSSQANALFSSLFLGYKTTHTQFLKNIKEYFKWWGISHYLARSGLHLIIFLFLCMLLFRFIPIAFFLKSIVLMSICLLYFTFSWSSISFLRAFITYLFYFFYTVFNCQINNIHILALVTSSILLFNPQQLFFLDFQLSFSLTFALFFINAMQHIKNRKLLPI